MKTILLLVAISPCLVIGAGCGTPSIGGESKVVEKRQRSTRLYVRTVPPGAKITIDGRPSGTSDRLLEFGVPAEAKKVLIEVELDGHHEQQDIIVRGGEIKRVEFDLSSSAPTVDPPSEPTAPGAPLGMVNKSQPVAVRTFPRSGDTQVDPDTEELRVTFSKDMQDGNWSWSQISDESFPETTGSPHYLEDQRTCVLPVKLQPGQVYVIWLNSSRFTNFKDTDGRSSVPYLLVFETKEE